MALNFIGKVVLHDEQGLKTTLSYDFGVVAGAVDVASAAAWGTMNGILAELADITTANIFSVSVNCYDDALVVGTLPAEAEIAEEAAIAVHLEAAPAPEKLAIIRVPAPVDALFLTDGVTVDTNNADLQAYTTVLQTGVYISDGESIASRGAAGMKNGWHRTRARSQR